MLFVRRSLSQAARPHGRAVLFPPHGQHPLQISGRVWLCSGNRAGQIDVIQSQAESLLKAVESDKPFTPELLKEVLEKARDLHPKSDLRFRLLRVVDVSLESLAPKLVKQGECVSVALQIPYSGSHMEPALKSVVLLLARRLRRQKGHGLPAKELPPLPCLLQRVGFRDHQLFDDFCTACATSWPDLSRAQLVQLFQNTEDYALLHPTQGPALARLSAAVAASPNFEAVSDAPLQQTPHSQQAPHSASALATLCLAVLAIRSRSLCAPLLEKLKTVFPKFAVVAATHLFVASQLLRAAAELHVAVGLPSKLINDLLLQCQYCLKEQLDAEQVEASLLDLVRACSLCSWTDPQGSEALFTALAPFFTTPASETSLRVVRSLPAQLRWRFTQAQLPATSSQINDFFQQQNLQTVEAWAKLIYDLPLLVVMPVVSANTLEPTRETELLGAALDSVVSKLVDHGTPLTPRTAVVAYIAASSLAHAHENFRLSSVKGETDPMDRLHDLKARSTQCLEDCLPKLSPRDVQALFRCPLADDSFASIALERLAEIRQVRTQLPLFFWASASTCDASAVDTGRDVVVKRLAELQDPKELYALEALLRRFHSHSHHEVWIKETLEHIRTRLYDVILESPTVWNRSPPRGYVRYIERCVARGRVDERSANLSDEEDDEAEETGMSAPGDGSPEATESAIGSNEDSFYPPDPLSPEKEIVWHRGLESWEVRVEAHGYKMLGGYFKPEDCTDEARDRALAAAMERRRVLLEIPPSRRHTPY